jgi:hypothetical protein
MRIFTARIISGIISLSIAASCLIGCSSQQESPLITNTTYYFYDVQDDLECYECDPCWCIRFLDNKTAELWSQPCSGSSNLKSCTSDVRFNFDLQSGVVNITSVSNGNVSSECRGRFVGQWVWSEGKFGKRFYSKNIAGCDFHDPTYVE